MHLPRIISTVLGALLLIVGCGGREEASDPPSRRAEKRETPEEAPSGGPLVIVLGDSIAAGLHLDDPRNESFPAVLERRLSRRGLPFRLVNAGVSGETTAGGASKIDWLLGQSPDLLVIEIGGNDGLRGIPVETTEENLRTIVDRTLETGARVLLLGVKLPPNYGADYVGRFEGIYERIARETGVAYLPYFMKGVGGVPDMNVFDGLHPNARGHEILADNLEEELARLVAEISRPEERGASAEPDR